MSKTSQHSPNITGEAANCFEGKLSFLSRIEGIRAIVIEKPIKKHRGQKPFGAKKKIWKEEEGIRNNVQYITWHNIWIKQRFMLVF